MDCSRHFLSQLDMFTRVVNGQKVWVQSELYTMMGLVGLTMLIMWLLPRVTEVVLRTHWHHCSCRLSIGLGLM